MANEYILEMKNITKIFPGVKALDDVTLKVRPATVHSLMGENGAGKSTLMNCLFGIYALNGGEIILDGQKVAFESPAEALRNHVSMVHQELNQVLDRNIMENIWLGRFPMKGIFVDHQKMYAETKKIFEQLDIHVDPRVMTGSLQVADRQMIEIAKAVSYDAKVIVMDEPTSSLTEDEVEHLFRIIEMLKKRGVKHVLITMGVKGCYCGDCGKIFPAKKVKAVDCVAAGDTFNGAFAVALAEGRPVAEAIDFAQKASAISVTRPGAQASVPYRREVV